MKFWPNYKTNKVVPVNWTVFLSLFDWWFQARVNKDNLNNEAISIDRYQSQTASAAIGSLFKAII
jgi:hypothetical protein